MVCANYLANIAGSDKATFISGIASYTVLCTNYVAYGTESKNYKA